MKTITYITKILPLILTFIFINSISFASNDYLISELPVIDDFPIDLPLGISITTFKGTYDIFGQTELKEGNGAGEADVQNGFALSLELGKTILEKMGLGVGATYQFPREYDEKGTGEAKFNFIPFYGLLKFWTDAAGLFPFGMIQIGYNLLLGNDAFKNYSGGESSDLTGGLYWGLGGGIILLNGIQLELLYSENNGSLNGDRAFYNGEVRYSKISISVGISL
jgi:hypothetical protein